MSFHPAPIHARGCARRDWRLGVIAEGEELHQDFLDYIRRDTRTAATVMVRHVFAAEEDMTLPRLAELMMKHNIKPLLVLRRPRRRYRQPSRPGLRDRSVSRMLV